jgi:hypothetical protein
LLGGSKDPVFWAARCTRGKVYQISYFLPRGATLEGEGEAARPAPHTLEVLKREKMYFFYF